MGKDSKGQYLMGWTLTPFAEITVAKTQRSNGALFATKPKGSRINSPRSHDGSKQQRTCRLYSSLCTRQSPIALRVIPAILFLQLYTSRFSRKCYKKAIPLSKHCSWQQLVLATAHLQSFLWIAHKAPQYMLRLTTHDNALGSLTPNLWDHQPQHASIPPGLGRRHIFKAEHLSGTLPKNSHGPEDHAFTPTNPWTSMLHQSAWDNLVASLARFKLRIRNDLKNNWCFLLCHIKHKPTFLRS